SYRKHLFSESNGESTSAGPSEKSWILDYQIRSLPKCSDYTRKRPRVRSKLKVLPVSSPSSSSDYEAKKRETPKQRAQKRMLRKKSTPSSKEDNLPIVDLTGGTVLEELQEAPLLVDESTSDVGKALQKLPDASGKLSREEESFKRKDSDMLIGTDIKKPKFSDWGKSNLSSDASHVRRKLFDSVGKEADIQTGKEVDDSVNDAFFPEMPHEDFSDSGVIAAFESFVGQLKKSFWSRHKRMEIGALSALRTLEKNVSTLLSQIHEC
ncbi:SYC2L protein, partial [Turnix velox]|nr:SYC2L protein [Turnix velox]